MLIAIPARPKSPLQRISLARVSNPKRHIAAVSDRSVVVVPYMADILTVIDNVAVSAAAAGAYFSQWYGKCKKN